MISISNFAGMVLTGTGLFINSIPTVAPAKLTYCRAPLAQWSCTPREHQEYHGACAHRKWVDQRIPKHG